MATSFRPIMRQESPIDDDAGRSVDSGQEGRTTITVIEPGTGSILSTHTINPNSGYWRNTLRRPGRWNRDT